MVISIIYKDNLEGFVKYNITNLEDQDNKYVNPDNKEATAISKQKQTEYQKQKEQYQQKKA